MSAAAVRNDGRPSSMLPAIAPTRGYDDAQSVPSKDAFNTYDYGSSASMAVPSSALVPHSTAASARRSTYDEMGGGRVLQLESRVDINERANRALLEETVRMQGDVKLRFRRHEEMLKEERDARAVTVDGLRNANEQLNKVVGRLVRLEDNAQMDSKSLAAFMSQMKQFERGMVDSIQDLHLKRTQDAAKIAQVQREFDAARESFEKARQSDDRKTAMLVEEIRQLRSRLETQSLESAELASELRQRVKRLESENRACVEALRRITEQQSSSDAQAAEFRGEISSRVAQLDGDFTRMVQKKGEEDMARRSLDEEIARSIGDLRSGVSDQDRRLAESFAAVQDALRAAKESEDGERVRMIEKIRDVLEAQGKRHLEKEARLRQEAQTRFAAMEKALMDERDARTLFENEARRESESRWKAARADLEGELRGVRDQQAAAQGGWQESLARINDQLNGINSELDATKRGMETVLRAEVKGRLKEEQRISGLLNELQMRVDSGISSVDRTIQDVDRRLSVAVEEARALLRREVTELDERHARESADNSVRVSAVANRMQRLEEDRTAEMERTAEFQRVLRKETQDAMAQWQEFTQQQLRDAEARFQSIPDKVAEIDERLGLFRAETTAKMEAEAQARQRELQQAKKDIGRKVSASTFDQVQTELQSRIAEIQARLNDVGTRSAQCEREINNTKAQLLARIGTESALRGETVMELKRDLVRLQTQNDALLRQRDDGMLIGNGTAADAYRDARLTNLVGEQAGASSSARGVQPLAAPLDDIVSDTPREGPTPDGDRVIGDFLQGTRTPGDSSRPGSDARHVRAPAGPTVLPQDSIFKPKFPAPAAPVAASPARSPDWGDEDSAVVPPHAAEAPAHMRASSGARVDGPSAAASRGSSRGKLSHAGDAEEHHHGAADHEHDRHAARSRDHSTRGSVHGDEHGYGAAEREEGEEGDAHAAHEGDDADEYGGHAEEEDDYDGPRDEYGRRIVADEEAGDGRGSASGKEDRGEEEEEA